MKSQKLLLLEKILRYMAIAVIKKHRPKIVAITGSVGKTTTKEMIFTVLSAKYSVRKSDKNYNNEVGVPLTIIGASSGGNSAIKWLGVFFRWLRVILVPGHYPEILVLEMGADRPGDIKYLCGYIPVNVGVITNIGISHLEYFNTPKELAKEKGLLLKSLPAAALAVYNVDDELVNKIGKSVKANNVGYGFHDGADMRASDMIYSYESVATNAEDSVRLFKGLSFKLNYKGKIIPVRLAHCIAAPQIYSALAAFATAVSFDVNLLEAAQTLEAFIPSSGRLNLLKGIKNTVIIDDTYNSAPDSTRAALDTLKKINAPRKIVALGDMLELGGESETAHRLVGKLAVEAGASIFIAVGKRMHDAAKEFTKEIGQNGVASEFDNPKDAGFFIQELMKSGDLVLVKGSQGMRMEKIVEEIMAEPTKKEELLVRQERRWKEKEFLQP